MAPDTSSISRRVLAAATRASKSVGSIVPEPDSRLGRSPRVSSRLAPRADSAEMSTRIGKEAQLRSNFSRLQQRMLVVGFELERFLVEGCRFREKPLVVQVVGNADELIDGFVRLSGAQVQVAEQIRRVPVVRMFVDHAHVFCDGSVDLALPQQFLSVSERCRAIDAHCAIWAYHCGRGGLIPQEQDSSPCPPLRVAKGKAALARTAS